MLDDIITDVLRAEGWDAYTDHPSDRGGPTKWGITLKAWEGWRGHAVTAEDVQNITEPQARDFYEAEYVLGPRFNHLPDLYAPLVVDCGVNHGTRIASKWVQRAVGARQDGVIGPKTLDLIGSKNPVAVYLLILSYRIKLYGKLVTRDPSQAVFAHGWNNRAAKWAQRLADYLTGG